MYGVCFLEAFERVPPGSSAQHGVDLVVDTDGSVHINAAIWSRDATAIYVCLFDESDNETAYLLNRGPDNLWHGSIPAGYHGQRYGLRADGPWQPEQGVRFNVHKLLIDPWARAFSGDVTFGDSIFDHNTLDDLEFNSLDSAGDVLFSVLTETGSRTTNFDWSGDQAPLVPWDQTVIYEMHVKGFTQLNEGIPEELRGTYAGLGHSRSIEYLKELGVTAVELLPIQQFISETHLLETGRTNYWGYNSIGYFAPHHTYSNCHSEEDNHDPASRATQIDEFKGMVKALHAEGIEVILDVVYNHTAEGDNGGPTYSFKGLDNGAYYKLGADDPRYYADYTGCGNTVDAHQPQALRLILDSLRYWVEEMHVDGFRFDLASAMARAPEDVDMLGGFIQAVGQDPILRTVKLIAEPWDIGAGGYQVGEFPEPWAEWNDKYRDCLRDFWRSEGGVQELGWRLTGSRDLYGRARRPAHTSINFVTAHDGFTLNDLVSFNEKHNEANGEDNADGSDHNRSWNSGAEGPTDDANIRCLRLTRMRSFLTSLLLSQGTPMIVAGDEFGRSQQGNNNAYCQDSPIAWINWNLEPWQEEQLEFVRRLMELRRNNAALRPRTILDEAEGSTLSNQLDPSASQPKLKWISPTGHETTEEDWADPSIKSIGLAILADEHNLDPGSSFLIALNGSTNDVDFHLPDLAKGDDSDSNSRFSILALSSDPGFKESPIKSSSGEILLLPPLSCAVVRIDVVG